ncbi:hypothetical protein M7I_6938 [Glarea lozoyensis 74030]|uniref:Uncharacterized protein n=1 Tax=Glarea lozoyensis (strain ATCC 74030 / MF5533) TaxID=1104152 RepID=H0EVY1_GLAL7|nr:hypothetical protein M7I_6938 [Glarea lozoyensis 74030]
MSEKQVKRLMNVSLPMSEADLHQLFAEAVFSGKPDSGLKSELISGIRTLTVDNESPVFWFKQVKFSHFIQNREHVGDDTGNKVTRIPVKTLLQAATSPEHAVTILRIERLPEELLPKFGETPAHNTKPILHDTSGPVQPVPSQPTKPIPDEQSPRRANVLHEPTISAPSSETSTSPSQPSPPSEASSLGVESHSDEVKTPSSEPEVDNKEGKMLESKVLGTHALDTTGRVAL